MIHMMELNSQLPYFAVLKHIETFKLDDWPHTHTISHNYIRIMGFGWIRYLWLNLKDLALGRFEQHFVAFLGSQISRCNSRHPHISDNQYSKVSWMLTTILPNNMPCVISYYCHTSYSGVLDNCYLRHDM